MSLDEKHGVKGKLFLRRNWKESASGHVESNDDVYLEAKGQRTVVMVHAHGHKEFYKTVNSDYVEDRFEIPADVLESFLRKHGKRVT